MKKYLLLLFLLPFLLSFTWNGATISTWNGATIATWNGATAISCSASIPAFTPVYTATPSTEYESNVVAVTLTGCASAAISISGNSGQYKINSGSYTTSTGTINTGDTVTVKQTSDGSGSGTTTLTIASSSRSFVIYPPFYDTFEGNNGDPPNTSYWSSINTRGTFSVGSYFNIQSNNLQFYGACSDGGYADCSYHYYLLNELSTQAGRTFTFTVLTRAIVYATTHFIIYNADSTYDVTADPLIPNSVMIEVTSGTVNIYLLDGSATISHPSSWYYSSNTTPLTVSMTLVDSTHVTVSVDGIVAFSNVAISGTFGTHIKASVYGQVIGGSYYTTVIGDVTWQ